MGIVIAAVAPHGFPIIPEVSDDADGAMKTREAMLEMQRRFANADPEVIFIVGPHGVQVSGSVTLANTDRAAGALTWNDRTVEMNVPIDTALSDAIAEAARAREVPVARVRFGAGVLPMDWGIMTPLWFAGHGRNMPGAGHPLADIYSGIDTSPGPPVVIANPARELPRTSNIEFGRAVAEAAAADGRRVAFIASCDWSHTHHESGPYGFHPAAAQMDPLIVEAIKQDRIMDLIDLDPTFVKNAAIDGLWQLLMLEGAKQVTPLEPDLLSYEAPTYYGMIVATYEPDEE
jgi:aromatic ring-opening dioxygenase LigB subunit